MKRLFFDIETTPNIVYSWRVGYKISLNPDNIIEERKVICICYKWESSKHVKSLVWDKDQSDRNMLEEFSKICEKADEVVAHNGDNFDVKWLRTRCIYYRIPFPDKVYSYDTLKKSRSAFRFNSNKLDYIAKYLGVGEKTETGGFDLWVKTINGDKQALKRMVDYCKNDVLILESVFQEIEKYVQVNTHVGVLMGGEKWTCVACGSSHMRFNGELVLKSGTKKYRVRCNECDKGHTVSGAVYRAFLQFKYGRVEKDSTNS